LRFSTNKSDIPSENNYEILIQKVAITK